MIRSLPMDACIALLHAFDPNNAAPQQAVNAASAVVLATIDPTAMADVNDGQFAAMIDLCIWKGADAFAISAVAAWVNLGNFVNPPLALATYGARGLAQRDVWNVGNSG